MRSKRIIAGELTKMAQNTVLVGQNVSFDEGFLTASQELGVKPPGVITRSILYL